jgi:hypothetical protein
VTTVTALTHHLRQFFLLADVLLFEVSDRLAISSPQWVDCTHSQNKHTKNYSFGTFNPNCFSEPGAQSVCSQILVDSRERMTLRVVGE